MRKKPGNRARILLTALLLSLAAAAGIGGMCYTEKQSSPAVLSVEQEKSDSASSETGSSGKPEEAKKSSPLSAKYSEKEENSDSVEKKKNSADEESTERGKEENKKEKGKQKENSGSSAFTQDIGKKTNGTGTASIPESEDSTGKSTESGKSDSPENSGAENSGQTFCVEHQWEPVLDTVHHNAVTHVVHHDPVWKQVHHDALVHEEPVLEYRTFCDLCGADLSGSDPAAHGCKGTWHTEAVQVGTTTVTDQEAYDESVLVREAWDEMVTDQEACDSLEITAYRCRICGVTR